MLRALVGGEEHVEFGGVLEWSGHVGDVVAVADLERGDELRGADERAVVGGERQVHLVDVYGRVERVVGERHV